MENYDGIMENGSQINIAEAKHMFVIIMSFLTSRLSLERENQTKYTKYGLKLPTKARR